MSNPTSELRKSSKSFSGKLNKLDYEELIALLESELNTTIPEGKSVQINYSQKARYCFVLLMNDKDNSTVTDNCIRISSTISSENNTLDFFVYTKDSFNRDIYSQKDYFRLDSWFFL